MDYAKDRSVVSLMQYATAKIGGDEKTLRRYVIVDQRRRETRHAEHPLVSRVELDRRGERGKWSILYSPKLILSCGVDVDRRKKRWSWLAHVAASGILDISELSWDLSRSVSVCVCVCVCVDEVVPRVDVRSSN